MNPFFAVVDLDGAPIGVDAVASVLPALDLAPDQAQIALDGCWGAAWVPSKEFGRPGVVVAHGVTAVGNVRITNRSRFLAGRDRAVWSDLRLLVEHYVRRGPDGIADLVGDFAFVLWDTRRSRVVAARDALGVKSLFYQRKGSRISVGSHLDCFDGRRYDREFIGEFLAGLSHGTSRTIFADVTRLEPGSWLVAEGGQVTVQQYWTAAAFEPADRVADERAAVDEFRALFEDAVAAQLDDGAPTWSQLSGGIDSSSVVATACRLAAGGRVRPLLGTQTVVDSLSEGDETRYSDAVVRQYGFRNEQIHNFWAWQPGEAPPAFAEPRAFLPFHARDRAMAAMVRDGGGSVLLSGFGADSYLSANYDFIADWAVQGRWRDALGQLTDLAVAMRQSFWSKAGRFLVAPLAPEWLRRRLMPESSQLPSWLAPRFAEQAKLAARLDGAEGRVPGRIFVDQVTREMGSIDLALERGVFEEGMEIRYPFLHRPLVEFSLRLPILLRQRPNRSKWILREAMGGDLPKMVRDRKGKGGIDGRLVWSLERERPVLERLIADSHLVSLGCVSGQDLAGAFHRARTGDAASVGLLFVTLSLETWFAVRSGWWKQNGGQHPPIEVNPSHEEMYHAAVL